MTLYLVREISVPVDSLVGGETLLLPSGRRVVVEGVDEFDGVFFVRWWRRAEHGEPGHRGGKNHAEAIGDEWDGRYLGSLMPLRQGETVRIARA